MTKLPSQNQVHTVRVKCLSGRSIRAYLCNGDQLDIPTRSNSNFPRPKSNFWPAPPTAVPSQTVKTSSFLRSEPLESSFLFFFWLHQVACRILAPSDQRLNPCPLQWKRLNHWTAREVPLGIIFDACLSQSVSKSYWHYFKLYPDRDFPGGPVVRTPHFHCRGHRFDPWSGD